MKVWGGGRGGGSFSGFKQSDPILNDIFSLLAYSKVSRTPTFTVPLCIFSFPSYCTVLFFSGNWVNSVSQLTYCQCNEPTIECVCLCVILLVFLFVCACMNIFSSFNIWLTVCKAKLMSCTSTECISVQFVYVSFKGIPCFHHICSASCQVVSLTCLADPSNF